MNVNRLQTAVWRRIFSPAHHQWRHMRFQSSVATQPQTENKIPVTVLSGFLGSGKTTLLNHALHNQSGLKIATIVNDMSEINIDSSMIEQGAFNRVDEQLVQLTNGCICCTLRQDLIEQIGIYLIPSDTAISMHVRVLINCRQFG